MIIGKLISIAFTMSGCLSLTLILSYRMDGKGQPGKRCLLNSPPSHFFADQVVVWGQIAKHVDVCKNIARIANAVQCHS